MSSLNRIVGAQEEHPGYEIALEEMKTGRKHSDWIWYIFPQMKGMGMGYDAEFYGIQSLFEARHYMENFFRDLELAQCLGTSKH